MLCFHLKTFPNCMKEQFHNILKNHIYYHYQQNKTTLFLPKRMKLKNT